MLITVEPRDGSELDRLITALLNLTGTVHRLIQDTGPPPDADGEEVMGVVAERIHAILAAPVEHHDDEELGFATGLLAMFTLLIADELDLQGLYFE